MENEIEELKKLFRVHVVTLDTERQMSQKLPKDVVFDRPAEKSGGLKRAFLRMACRFSNGYKQEAALAKAEGRFTPAYQKHLLNTLVKSRLIYNYIRSQELFEQEAPLLIYSSNFNDYLYGLCCLKEYAEDIRVVSRCHNANMFNPRTGKRRETMNGAINRLERPCAKACGMNAISSDAQGKATIDYDKCVSCGMCIVNCPFGAIAASK